jgi:hypothetical protein
MDIKGSLRRNKPSIISVERQGRTQRYPVDKIGAGVAGHVHQNGTAAISPLVRAAVGVLRTRTTFSDFKAVQELRRDLRQLASAEKC